MRKRFLWEVQSAKCTAQRPKYKALYRRSRPDG